MTDIAKLAIAIIVILVIIMIFNSAGTGNNGISTGNKFKVR